MEYHDWILFIVEINVHMVEMLPLVERGCHQWMRPLVERNVNQGIPLIDSGDQGIPLVDSGNQGPMDPKKHVFLPLVERD